MDVAKYFMYLLPRFRITHSWKTGNLHKQYGDSLRRPICTPLLSWWCRVRSDPSPRPAANGPVALLQGFLRAPRFTDHNSCVQPSKVCSSLGAQHLVSLTRQHWYGKQPPSPNVHTHPLVPSTLAPCPSPLCSTLQNKIFAGMSC